MQKEKIRLEELLGIHQVLSYLFNSLLQEKTHYWLDRVFEPIEKESKKLDESRKRLIDKYVARDEDGKPILSPDKTKFEFEPNKLVTLEKEFGELLQEEIEIDIYKFKWEDFKDIKITGLMRRILKQRFIIDEVPEV